jgi:hypothetical protein
VGIVVRLIALTAAGVLILGACSSGPVRSFSAGDELARFDFSEPATFEEGAYRDATLRIVDGVYRITVNEGDNEVWWSQWGDTLDNVVIDVVVEQTSQAPETAYGVGCRMRGQVGQEMAVDPTLAAIVSGDAAEPTEDVTSEAIEESTEEATRTCQWRWLSVPDSRHGVVRYSAGTRARYYAAGQLDAFRADSAGGSPQRTARSVHGRLSGAVYQW